LRQVAQLVALQPAQLFVPATLCELPELAAIRRQNEDITRTTSVWSQTGQVGRSSALRD